jgi:hypothetical protein
MFTIFSTLSWIFGSWASWSKLRGNDDDDWVDRLNHLYTVLLLCVFAVFTGGGQYVGDPIQCWCPAQFTSIRHGNLNMKAIKTKMRGIH